MGIPMEDQTPGQEQSSPFLPPPSQSQPYYGIPSPYQDPPTTYILLPAYPRRRRRHCHCCSSLLSSSSLLTLSLSLLLLLSAAFFLFPSDPEIKVARLRLDRIRLSTSPAPKLDISLALKLRIRNRDFFSLGYRSIVVSVGYRGRTLGFVTSDGGRISARGVSYVDAELKLDGIKFIGDLFYLIEDLASGSIPFETVTEVDGELHVLFLDVPVEGRISCAVNINPENQTIVRQDCYPE